MTVPGNRKDNPRLLESQTLISTPAIELIHPSPIPNPLILIPRPPPPTAPEMGHQADGCQTVTVETIQTGTGDEQGALSRQTAPSV